MKLSIAIIFSLVLSFAISALLGFVLIPWLRKLKFGQTILDIGPAWHKSKQGTPVMGGIMFIVSSIVTFFGVILTDKLLGGNLLVACLKKGGVVRTYAYDRAACRLAPQARRRWRGPGQADHGEPQPQLQALMQEEKKYG